MAISKKAQEYRERMIPGTEAPLATTDPEFVELFENFAFGEVVEATDLDDRTRFLGILATLLGCQGLDEYKVMLPAALNMGVSPTEAKEVVYQATAYLGVGRTYPFLQATNEILSVRGVKLPLEPQGTTTPDDRVEKGEACQVQIFGDRMRGFAKSGPADVRHINRFLAGNCFGDYYTRSGLTLAEREMVTFCFIAAQGGCEPQLTSHAVGNMRMGNDRAFLIRLLSSNLPYIGYPRSLNALRCVNEAAKAFEEAK
ncbi:MAG: carboxymuconolactone decarboxylase family protein [Atopobiaceae bacterium]|jgi:4-carboxymuconolactone decarboxylase|nr:carboxymuconolactone decarboxylase family protein [Atopobiaceae bacterium]